MILIIGSEEETHSAHIYQHLKKKNIPVKYFDSRKYPEKLLTTWSPNNIPFESFLTIDNEKIAISDIQGIYWRWFYGIVYPKVNFGEDSNHIAQMAVRECESNLNSLFASLDSCNWVNSYKAIQLHKTKTHQLNLMAKNGIRVPKTLITNNKDVIYDFWEKNNKNVIYKPVLGGAFTKKLTKNDFKKSRLEGLKYSPIQLQECIDGVDIRVYCLGDKIYPAEIRANTLDFREDDKSKIVPTKLPNKISKNCLKILKLMELKYSGIDIRKSNDGEYVFIEANPAPMFIHFENVTKYPITNALIKLLVE